MEFIFASNGTLYYNMRGMAEGTSYNIIYQDDEERNFELQIIDLLAEFERSLSVYDPASIISRINRNEDVEVDDYFCNVFSRAKEISILTDGKFDISAEPLFRAWGFSFEKKSDVTDESISALRQYIGMNNIELIDRRIVKSNPNIILNANAIAKGYSSDLIAELFDKHNIKNYLVEIGGEIRVKGKNSNNDLWRIGIDRPSDNNLIPGQDMQVLFQLSDKGIATSGNYRQYYIKDGRKIAHTIDPSTGYPVQHNLLSVTVVANDTITADAFATAFLVAGIDISKEWIKDFPYLDALFIYDECGEYKVYYTEGIEKYII